MIDTDKYEGHTDDFIWTWKHYASHLDHGLYADRALIQDAPLLLAEVKRLREQLAKANKFVYSICQHSVSMLMDYEDYMKGDEEE